MIRAACGHIQRIGALRIRPNNDQPNHGEMARYMPPNPRFDMLEHLDYTLGYLGDCFPGEGHELFNADTLPSIRTLKVRHWNGDVVDMFCDISTFPWKRLQSLHLDTFRGSAASLITSLAAFPQLSRFGITTDDPDTAVESLEMSPNVVLDRLSGLTIQVLKPPTVVDSNDPPHPNIFLVLLLEKISTPALQSLTLLEYEHEDRPVFSKVERSLPQFLKGSDGTLVADLSLWDADDSSLSPQPFPDVLASVRQLIVRPGPTSSRDFLLEKMLSASGEKKIYFPNLTHLRLVAQQFDPVLLVQTIASRQRTGQGGGSDTSSTIAVDNSTDGIKHDQSSKVLSRVEIQYSTTPSPSAQPASEMRHFIEIVTRAGLSTCKLDASFIISFDSGEFALYRWRTIGKSLSEKTRFMTVRFRSFAPSA